MAVHGAFTEKTARHSDTTGLEQASDRSVRSVTEVYEVILPKNTTAVNPSEISGLPAKDSQHATYSTLYVAGYTWEHPDPGSVLWRCRVKYETRTATTSSDDDVERIVSLDWGSTSAQADVTTDARLALPVQNGAGDLFDTVPTIEEVYPTVHLVQREKRHRAATLALDGKINRAAFTVAGVTFQPHCCRLRVTCRKLIGETDLPYEYSYTFEGRNHYIDSTNAAWLNGTAINGYTVADGKANIGWDVELVQAGFQYLANGVKTKFTVPNQDGGVSEPSLPMPIDKDGAPVTDGNLYILVVFAYEDADFSSLRVPTSA